MFRMHRGRDKGWASYSLHRKTENRNSKGKNPGFSHPPPIPSPFKLERLESCKFTLHSLPCCQGSWWIQKVMGRQEWDSCCHSVAQVVNAHSQASGSMRFSHSRLSVFGLQLPQGWEAAALGVSSGNLQFPILPWQWLIPCLLLCTSSGWASVVLIEAAAPLVAEIGIALEFLLYLSSFIKT